VLADQWAEVQQRKELRCATFADVPPSHPFYQYVETAVAHGAVSGDGVASRFLYKLRAKCAGQDKASVNQSDKLVRIGSQR